MPPIFSSNLSTFLIFQRYICEPLNATVLKYLLQGMLVHTSQFLLQQLSFNSSFGYLSFSFPWLCKLRRGFNVSSVNVYYYAKHFPWLSVPTNFQHLVTKGQDCLELLRIQFPARNFGIISSLFKGVRNRRKHVFFTPTITYIAQNYNVKNTIILEVYLSFLLTFYITSFKQLFQLSPFHYKYLGQTIRLWNIRNFWSTTHTRLYLYLQAEVTIVLFYIVDRHFIWKPLSLFVTIHLLLITE